jgi:hypothetical protein
MTTTQTHRRAIVLLVIALGLIAACFGIASNDFGPWDSPSLFSTVR